MTFRAGIYLAVLSMAAIVILSNILVHFLLGEWLTYAAFTYPFAFLITDLSNRLYGSKVARLIVLIGFFTGILGSLIGTQIYGEFGPLVTLRVAIASGAAFLLSQLLDIKLFYLFFSKAQWWKAPLFSSIIGGSIDTLLFFSVAFDSNFSFLEPSNDVSWANTNSPLLGWGPEVPFWLSLSVADFITKLGIVFVSLIPFRLILNKVVYIENVKVLEVFQN